ncbi:MAG: DNA-directed RNA polymerase subunit delta [bacterium]|nr:DNA-directed RNA polymerase subunit delta [bacterium]
MKITDLSKEELESKSYDDIAYMILENSGEKIKITDLFKQICDLLGLSDSEYEAKIADFFQVLSTDQRFMMLEKGFWDLKSRHQAKIIIEDEEDDIESDNEEPEEDEAEEDSNNVYYDEDEPEDDNDDDLQGLVVVSDDSDEENANLD